MKMFKAAIIWIFLLTLVYWFYQYSRVSEEVKKYYIPAKYYSVKYGVPYEIILAVIKNESSGRPEVIGDADEYGLMQVRQIAVDDLLMNGFNVQDKKTFDVWGNINQCSSFLKLQIDRMRGDIFDGLRAYNAGQAGANRNGSAGLFYANKVLNIAEGYGFRSN